VADYITSRTVDTVTPGSDTPTGTFGSSTYPTDEQVERLIAAACGWVESVTGTLTVDLEGTAGDVAAMRAAGLVELSYPLRNNEIDEVANALLSQAQSARDELVAANRAAGGTVISPSAPPIFSFPDASAWRGDTPAWRHE
jgi:hypothetical protein